MTRRLARMLDFFGVAYERLPHSQLWKVLRQGEGSRFRLLGAARQYVELLEELDRRPGESHTWKERVHSAFVYANADHESLNSLMKKLGQGAQRIESVGTDREIAVTDGMDDFCGIMSGVRAFSNTKEFGSVAALELRGKGTDIITAGGGAVFVRVEHEQIPVFLLTSHRLVDIDSDLATRNYDVRERFLESVPPVLYIKWAFAGVSWTAAEINACLVIDDPLLRRNYGCVDFQELLALTERHGFSANVAFIPWNWRRSRADVARLFRDHPQRLSLSIHGCDHTGGEFGTGDARVLSGKAKLAAERMKLHESTTGIRHAEVMVFPQGVFSAQAMGVLKHANYVAAVNTELLSVDSNPHSIKVSDAWDVAVMCYDCFPLFTRRYPSDNIANFAFDALLGKPIIIVIHHDFCRNRCAELAAFIQRLNRLKGGMIWRDLGEVVRRSQRHKATDTGEVEVEMYGSELRLDNEAAIRRRFRVIRRETDPSGVKAIDADSRPMAWHHSSGHIRCEIDLDPGETTLIRVHFHTGMTVNETRAPLSERLKTSLRRYLSEARDNYVVPSKIRLAELLTRAEYTDAPRG
jgi:hypothetical protein